MQKQRIFRKPDLLFVLVLVAAAGIFTSPWAAADDALFGHINLFRNVQFEQWLEGDVRIAGDRRAGLHLMTQSPTGSAHYLGLHQDHLAGDAGAHLAWKISW